MIGDVVYEKDGYAIHKIDGEEHKVCRPALLVVLSQNHFKLTLLLSALRTKPLTIRKALPRHQICLL